MKRKKLSRKANKRTFSKGNGVKSKNHMTGGLIYRGGIRL